MTTAYVGLGSNEGDRMGNLAKAVQALSQIPDTHVDAVSEAYESEPAYMADQARFANAVAEVSTSLSSRQLLAYLLQVEETLGRVRAEPNGPRAIDLDLLLYGDEENNSPDLTLPHPGLVEREFVVVPLLDIAPRIQLPDGTTVTREGAGVGPVVGELGAIEDLGVEDNAPVVAADWVEVASCDAGQDVVTGWDAAISFQREVLKDSGIPYAFDPYPPDAVTDPWGMPITFKILVPARFADKANALITEAMAAEPQFPAELED